MRIQNLCLAAILLLLTACSGPGPADTVKTFYKNIEGGELQAAVELLASGAREQVSDDKLKAGFEASTRQIRDKGGIKKLTTVEETIIGEIADVTMKIEFGNGTADEDKSSLILEEGEWRMRPSSAK